MDGTGTAASFNMPGSLAVDSDGNTYVTGTANATIRKITPAGVVTTLAGSAGTLGTADGNSGTARFNHPTGIAADAAGNLYIADTTNNTIRKVTAAGDVTTMAGLAGVSGSSDGTGSGALFNNPAGLAVDSAGNIYVADSGNSVIRKITSAGVVTTLAGLPTIAGLLDGTGTGAWFNQPKAVAVDSSGNVYVGDTGNASIRKITPAGVVTTLALSVALPPAPAPAPAPAPTPTPAPAPRRGGGGGAPSFWFVGLLMLLGLARRFSGRCRV